MLDSLDKHSQFFTGYTELRQHTNRSSQLVMRKGSLIENRQVTVGGVSARCYGGGAFGFASAPGDDDQAVGRVISQATDNIGLFQRKFSGAQLTFSARCSLPRRGHSRLRSTTPVQRHTLRSKI